MDSHSEKSEEVEEKHVPKIYRWNEFETPLEEKLRIYIERNRMLEGTIRSLDYTISNLMQRNDELQAKLENRTGVSIGIQVPIPSDEDEITFETSSKESFEKSSEYSIEESIENSYSE